MTTQVVDQVPRIQYTATASQTIFPYGFLIFVDADITVEQNGTIISAYTVTGATNTAGGSVILTTGATVGDIITVYRSQGFDRETDYQASGDFLAETVNDDFNRIILMMQQNREAQSRSLAYSVDDIVGSSLLPLSGARANNLLGFDASGNPTAIPAVTAVSTGNTTDYELGSTAALASHTGVITGHVIKTNYLTSARTSGSGSEVRFSGTTTGGNAGNWPHTDGYFYDADGKQFAIVGGVSVLQFGAIGNDTADDTQSFNDAITYCEATNSKLLAPQGTYKITDILYIGKGIPIEGEFQSATENMGTTIKHYSNSTLFYYNSDAVSGAQNTGGGISKMLIVKADGYSGGNAIIVYNTDDDGDTNKRASTFNFSELTISVSGTGLWQRGMIFDGLQYDTAGSRGLRNFSIYKVRVASCTEDDEYVIARQLTHLSIDMLQIDTGSGTGDAGLTIEGYSQNILMSNCNINGRLYIPSTATAVVDLLFTGQLDELDNQLASTTGGMYFSTSPTVTTQSSPALRVYDSSGNGLRYLSAGLQTGYSNKVISTYSGANELLRIGHLSASTQTVTPQKNDGQVWIYANASDYETSGTQISYKFEIPRFRPSNDNAVTLGHSSNRWSVVYAGTGTINTSDAREKTFFDIEDAETAAALEIKANLRKFKFNNAIEEKGENAARIHFGVSAQQVGEILSKHGLTPSEYAFYCYDEWAAEDATPEVLDEEGNVKSAGSTGTEAGNRYGIRYDELLSFIVSAL